MRKTAAALAALLMALGSLAVVPGTAAGIDSGSWQLNLTTKNFYLQTVPMTWVQAEAYAVSLGGHLVTINNQAEQDWLEATFTERNLWIGFNDRAIEGNWIWASGVATTYTNWSSGEPNNCTVLCGAPPDSAGEDAAVMNWLHENWPGPGTQPLGWNDLPENGLLGGIVEAPGLTTHETKGAATTFKMWYPGATTWTCSGARVVNRVSVKDSETCLASGNTDGFIAGTYQGNPTGPLPPYSSDATWHSDFDGSPATSWKITMVDNGNGTFTAYIVAYY